MKAVKTPQETEKLKQVQSRRSTFETRARTSSAGRCLGIGFRSPPSFTVLGSRVCLNTSRILDNHACFVGPYAADLDISSIFSTLALSVPQPPGFFRNVWEWDFGSCG